MNDNEPKNQRVAKTVLTLTMLHPVDLDPSQMSEADIAYHLGEGEFIGVRTSIETTAIADEDVGAELQQVGGEPSRSEEHTSELQSLMRISYSVFCLTNTKKKK